MDWANDQRFSIGIVAFFVGFGVILALEYLGINLDHIPIKKRE